MCVILNMDKEICYLNDKFVITLNGCHIGDIEIRHFTSNIIKHKRITLRAYQILCRISFFDNNLTRMKLLNVTPKLSKILEEIQEDELIIEKFYESMGGESFFTPSRRSHQDVNRGELFILEMMCKPTTDPLLLSIYLYDFDFVHKYINNVRSNKIFCYRVILSLYNKYASANGKQHAPQETQIIQIILNNILLRWFLLSQLLVLDIRQHYSFKQLL